MFLSSLSHGVVRKIERSHSLGVRRVEIKHVPRIADIEDRGSIDTETQLSVMVKVLAWKPSNWKF